MGLNNKTNLKSQASTIRHEDQDGMNTAERVGKVLEELIESADVSLTTETQARTQADNNLTQQLTIASNTANTAYDEAKDAKSKAATAQSTADAAKLAADTAGSRADSAVTLSTRLDESVVNLLDAVGTMRAAVALLTPEKVADEATMEAMIKDGTYTPGQIYYTEEED